MIFDSKTGKRLIIYFIYDKQGIVDDYILYMLKALKEVSTEIVAVCNGKITDNAVIRLKQYTSDIIIRDNEGFDVWAYKTALDKYGWEKLSTYDEVIMMNFTIMGPVYPITEMFDSMNARDLDFWGISKFHEYKDGDPFGTIEVGYIPEHIQSHFIAVRKDMLNSDFFHNYWDNMGPIRDYRDAVGLHEAMFTKRFADKGYKWDVYADMGEGYNNHPILCATREMMEEKRCPFFKRRSFMQDYTNILTDTCGQEAVETLDYIKNNTDYDVDMIWQNILRLENQADIKKNLQLNFVADRELSPDMTEVLAKKKVALVIHIYYEELVEYCAKYAASMPKEADIYVTVGSDNVDKKVREVFGKLPNKLEVIRIENRGRDVSALLVGTKKFIMDYDYVCFAHDKKVVQIQPMTVGYGFSYKCFENILGTKDMVNNIINMFEKNPRLGFLTPPPPNHGQLYFTLGLEWGPNFETTKKLYDKLELTVPMTEHKEPVAPLGTMFWFRPKAMKLLFYCDWEYEDFPKEPNKMDGTLLHAVERIYSYVVQQEGYYPGWIMSDRGYSIEVTNLNHMLRSLNRSLFFNGPGAAKFEEVNNNLGNVLNDWHWLRFISGQEQFASFKTRLYVPKDGIMSEENSFESYNLPGTWLYRFENLEEFGEISSLRWDPGESSGICIRSIKMTVTNDKGKEYVFRTADLDTNGYLIDDSIAFFKNDPQVTINLKKQMVVKKLDIEVYLTVGLPENVLSVIEERIVDKTQRKKMKKAKKKK